MKFHPVRWAAVYFLAGVLAFAALWIAYPEVALGAIDGVLGGVLGTARP